MSDRRNKNEIWKYFDPNPTDSQLYVCQICHENVDNKLQTKYNNTHLLKHLKKSHNITVEGKKSSYSKFLERKKEYLGKEGKYGKKCGACGGTGGRFRVPKNPEKRLLWMKLLGCDELGVDPRICDRHFNPQSVRKCQRAKSNGEGFIVTYKLLKGSLPKPAKASDPRIIGKKSSVNLASRKLSSSDVSTKRRKPEISNQIKNRGNLMVVNGVANVFEYLSDSICTNNDPTSDVVIYCSDGTVSAHKLVLASLSTMMYNVFTDSTWDETISVILPDVSSENMRNYLLKLYKGEDMRSFQDINQIISCKVKSHMSILRTAEEDTKDSIISESTTKPIQIKLLSAGGHEDDNDLIDDLTKEIDPFHQDFHNPLDSVNDIKAEIIDTKPMINVVENENNEDDENIDNDDNNEEMTIRDEDDEFNLYFDNDPIDYHRRTCKLCKTPVAKPAHGGKRNRDIALSKHLLTEHDIVLGFTEKKQINYLLKYFTKSIKPEPNLSRANWICKMCDQPVSKRFDKLLLHLRNRVNNMKT